MITTLPEHILRLMSPKDRAALGKGALTAAEAIDKAQAREEGKMHDIVIADLRRRGIPFIHASMRRRVHDLPKGWPDITAFFGGRVAMVELKAPTGNLSGDQCDRIMELSRAGCPVLTVHSAGEAIDFIKQKLGI